MSRGTAFKIAAILIVLALIAGGVLAFRGAGRWLVRQDPLQPADAIVILSGSMPARAEEGARIFGMGYAREIWLTQPAGPARRMAALGIPFVREEDYNREVLIREGVPDFAVRVLPGTIVDTEQELDEVIREMRLEGLKTVIIVTSPQHTRRVRVLWRDLAPRDLHAFVRAAYEDPFDAGHWWRNTRDSLAVTREMLGLLNAWSGLPVRPRSR